MKLDEFIALVLAGLLSGYDNAKAGLKNLSAKALSVAKKLFFCGVIGYILSILLAKIGQELDSHSLVSWGFIGKAFSSLIICGMGAVVASTIESVVKMKRSGQAFFYAVRVFFLFNLFFALLVSFSGLVSAGPIKPEMITLPFLAFLILAIAQAFPKEMLAIKIITYSILTVVVLLYFSPHSLNRALFKLGMLDAKGGQANLVRVCPGDFKEHRIPTTQSGEVCLWYFQLPSGKFEFFDGPGGHDFYLGELKKIDNATIVLVENDESKISERNLSLCESKPAPDKEKPDPLPLPKITEFPPPAPPPAPIPEVLPPAPPAEPVKQADNRPEFAVIALNGQNVIDEKLTRAVIVWVGKNRAISGSAEYASDQTKLAGKAQKIVWVSYHAKSEPANGQTRCQVFFETKVVDAESGKILTCKNNTFSHDNKDKATALRSAMRVTLQEIKSICQSL